MPHPQPDTTLSAVPSLAARLRRYLVPILALGLCLLALFTAQHLTKTLDYHAVIATLL
jgi:hypothetical protein